MIFFFMADDRDYMAGAVLFEAANHHLPTTKKMLKEAEQEVRQGMADHLKTFTSQHHGCLLSSLLIDPNSGLSCSVVKKCPPEVGLQLAAALSESEAGGVAASAGFLAFGPRAFVLPLLGRMRNVLARSLVPDLAARGDSFTWVLDFPLFVIGTVSTGNYLSLY